MFIVIWANIFCYYLNLVFKKKGLRIMFGGRNNFGVMLHSQHFYNKSYVIFFFFFFEKVKNCYW